LTQALGLSGRRALVTGSTTGIGKAIADCLAAVGADVVRQGLPDDVLASDETTISADLASVDGVAMLIAKAGPLDILVSNVAIQLPQPLGSIDRASAVRQVDANLLPMIELVQAVLPAMRASRWGRIVTIGSVQEHRPHRDMLVYAGLKAAQANIVRNVARQVAADGITVNNVAPGVIQTGRNAAALADPIYRASLLDAIPANDFGVGDDVAALVTFLCSDAARYITGVSIPCDGGLSLSQS
jgi:glucose 1-dehydrogenase